MSGYCKPLYTTSVASEKKFLVSLLKNQRTELAHNEKIATCSCPKCHKGTVITKCIHGLENNGMKSWHFEHYCDKCGENFIPNKIRSSIFFHQSYTLLETLNTPFGAIHVKRNGNIVPFRHRINNYEDFSHTGVERHILDIYLPQLKLGDIIFCGFDEDLLEWNDSDERSVLYSCENDKHLLGLCAFEPFDYDISWCCFQLENYTPKGFYYRVTADPSLYDEQEIYQAKVISLSSAWLNKKDYADADLTLFLALTEVIG